MSVDLEAVLLDGGTLRRLRELMGAQEFDALMRDSLAAYADYCEVMLRPSSSPAAIAAEAHKLRGSAGSLGFPAVGSAAARVEAAIEAGASGAEALVHELRQTIVATVEALAAGLP